MTLQGIIFDMDGTLADTEEIHRVSFNEAFANASLPFHWDRREYKQLLSISGGRERLRRYLQARISTGALPENVTVEDIARRLHEIKSDVYRRKLVDGHVALRSGVGRLITEATRRGLKLAIATSSSTRNVETLLRVALGDNGPELFSAIVTCDVIAEQKPSPAVYRHALELLGLPPGVCVALEDTRNGNLAARAAGLVTVITTHLFTTDNDFSGAALVLDQLGDPDHPANVVAGDLLGNDYVDIALLEKLLKP